MPSPTSTRPTLLKRVFALLLTFTAGVVDIVGYLSLYHTFTAHMTGTTVHLGNSLVSGRWPEAMFAGTVVVAFVVGSIIGRTIIEIGARRHFRSIASITLALEALLLLAFIPLAIHSLATHGSGESSYMTAPLLAMLAAAMGLQTATLTRVGPLTVHTTFVTGMFNKLAQLISHLLFETYALHRAVPARKAHYRGLREVSAARAKFIAGIWLLYVSGAVAGSLLEKNVGPSALYLSITLLACAIAVDYIRPLSLEEEKDQSER